MKQLLFVSLSFLLISTTALGQNNMQMAEAKAAYLLAEEDFNAGKYESAISYLTQATDKLGGANAKILYLKIMAEKAMVGKDASYFPKLKESIAAFEKAPDAASFNEEKYLEVVKLKLQLSQKTAEDFAEEAEGDMTDIYKRYSVEGFYLGAKLEEMQKARPDFFAKARKTLSKDSTEEIYSANMNIAFKKGKVIRMQGFFMTNNEDKNFSKGNALQQRYISMFSGTPEVKKETNSYVKGTSTTQTNHRWMEGKLIAVVTYSQGTYNLGFGNKAYDSSGGFLVQLNK